MCTNDRTGLDRRKSRPRSQVSGGDRAQSGGPLPDELLDRFLTLDGSARSLTFCTVREAARVAAVGPRTVQRWVESGEVHAVLVGPRYWLLRDSLYQFLRERAERR